LRGQLILHGGNPRLGVRDLLVVRCDAVLYGCLLRLEQAVGGIGHPIDDAVGGRQESATLSGAQKGR
jgi:hypothetical protein